MSVDDFLNGVTQGVLIVIALLTLLDFLRNRDWPRFDIALVFGDLAVLILLTTSTRLLQLPAIWISTLGAFLLLIHPFLLLRLVRHFRPVPRLVMAIAWGGVALSFGVAAVAVVALPGLVAVLIVLYFIVVEGYSAWAFLRGALTTAGVTRNRLGLAAIGGGLLALSVVLNSIAAFFPALKDLYGLLNRLIVPFAMLAFYFGFAPPRWLRRSWQLPGLFTFLRENSAQFGNEDVAQTLARFCAEATRTVGGVAVAVLYDEATQQFTLRASTSPLVLPPSLPLEAGLLERAWRSHRTEIASTPADFGPQLARLAATLDSQACLALPIATSKHAWGMLLTFLWSVPLFVSDDLAVLALLGEQAAVALDYGALLGEQRKLVAEMRHNTTRLEEANKELEAFSYSVSHDLRAPLRSVIGFSVAAMEDYGDKLDADGRHMLQTIQDAAGEMGRLIDDLLTFSRLGRQQLTPGEINMAEQARSVFADVAKASGREGLELTVGALPNARGDRAMMRQVWMNLLSNAVKFTRQREQPRIEAGSTTNDHEVIYYVKDNGAGFDMQYASKLFGVFQRLHTTDEFEGTGIGLSIVRRVITRHGGRTWAEGEVGKGATIFFSLPLGETRHV